MIIPSKFDGYGEGGRLTSTRRVYDSGGGGGGGPPATQTQISDLPDWAKPSAQKLLGKAETLTESGRYQPFQGERVAGFSPLQQQAFQGATRMDAGPQGFAQQVPQYMSPYMQNVIDREKMEAARASQILGMQQQARATQTGAFGGYRDAIERAERERGLRTQLQDIQTRGLQSAYDRAADQFRTGITQGLAVGQQQAQLGGMQQQREQSILSQQYQDFLNQQRYPYQQLEFMSNILRGTPMGTVQTLYGGQPTIGQQIGALGLGAYGLSRMFAEGGEVDSYAEGGVTSDENVEGILDKLSKEQLMQSREIAMAQRDMERVQMIDAELAERASMEGGLGMAFNMLPQEQQDAVTEMAGGGIVAFAGDEDENDPRTGQLVRTAGYTPGSPEDYRFFLGEGRKLFAEMGRQTPPTAMTVAERAKARANYLKELEEGAGESPYKKRLETISAEQAALAGNLEKAKGLGALRAAAAMLQGQGLVRGIGMAGGAFADTYEKAEAANRAENRALKAMEFNLLDAQRKERMGLNKEASAAMREADRDRAAAAKAHIDRLAAQARLAQGMATAAKPQRPTGAGAGGAKALKINEQLAAAEVAFETNPTKENEARVTALRRAVSQVRTSDVGPVRAAIETFRTTSTADTEVEKQVRNSKFSDAAWLAAYEKSDARGMAAAEDEIAKRIIARRTATPPAAAARPASTPVNINSGQGASRVIQFDAQGRRIP